MTKTIGLNPITRIEGHLGVRLEVEENRVTSAYVSGEMFRGFEQILRGRDPQDAQQITQRICGVCPVEHGTASVLAQEMAYGIRPPDNGRVLRNLIQAANIITSHITHFYLLSGVDFVDVAAVTNYRGSDPGLAGLARWVKEQLASTTISPASPFLPRYTADYLKEAEANFTVLRHYLDAFDIRAVGHKMGAVFAGKLPHAATLVAGGVTDRVSALKIAQYESFLGQVLTFIDHAYLPDVVEVAKAFPNYFTLGQGCGNFLAFGAFPEGSDGARTLYPSGTWSLGGLKPLDPGLITEEVSQSWYSSDSGGKPTEGITTPDPGKSGAYSWLKAPRYGGQPMEVGAVARLLVAYHQPEPSCLRAPVDALLKTHGREPKELASVMGRHAARALEAKQLAVACEGWLAQLQPDAPTCAEATVPESGHGHGLTEAARGALGHWIEIRGQKIHHYQCVVPTTWNASPRDDRGVPGPIEQALAGLALADPENPIEAARVVRSFDPCLACAVH